MTARDFCFWLQGKLEIDAAEHGTVGPTVRGLSASQVEVIARHLALVFAHDIDPQAGGPDVQKELNQIHNPVNKWPPDHSTSGVTTVMRC